MKIVRWAAAIVAVAIAGSLLVLWRCSARPLPDSSAARETRRSPGGSAVSADSMTGARVELPDSAAEAVRTLRVLVHDASGRPIPRALVAPYDGVARTLAPGDGTAFTDARGEARLPWPDASGCSAVAASKAGWRPAATAVEEDQDSVVLALEPGITQRFHVADLDGNPVEGAVVTLSLAGLPFDFHAAPSRWPAPLAQAVFRGVVDATGMVELSGLGEVGEYITRVHAAGYVPRMVPDLPLQVPGPTAEFVLEPLAGVVAEVAGSKVRAVAYDWPEPALLAVPRPPGQGAWMMAQLMWQRRFPGAVTYVAVVNPARRDALAETPQFAELAVFVDGRGWGVGRARLRSLPEVRHPEPLHLTWQGRGQRVRLVLVAADGSRIEQGTLTVRTESPLEGAPATFEVPLGAEVELPMGEYETTRRQFAAPFVVTAGSERIEIPVAARWRRIRIIARLPDGSAPDFALIELSNGGRSRSIGACGGETSTWITDGPLAVRVRVAGAEPWQADHPGGLTASTLTCPLVWQR